MNPRPPSLFEFTTNQLRSAPIDFPTTPSDEQLARYACGWLGSEESNEIVAALTRSAELRKRLMEIRSYVPTAETNLETQGKVFEARPALRTAIEEALQTSIAAYANWDRACADAFQGQNESPVVWGALRQLWSNLRVKRAAVAKVAFARSSESYCGPRRARVVVFPSTETADLIVERTDDDVLQAYALFTQPSQIPRDICLYMLEDEGGWVRLGGALTFGSEWKLSIPAISRALDLPSGPLEPHHFALTLGRWSGEKRTILLKVSDSVRRAMPSRIIRLQLKGAASIRNGNFHMTVVLPEEIRSEFYETRLDAGLQLSPSLYVVLGDWKMQELPDGTDVELVCPMPIDGIPDCELEYHAGLRLSINSL